MAMRVEVMGTGCMNCKRLLKNVERAVSNTGVEVDIVKVEDVDEIVSKGIMMTPALAIDGNIVSNGRVPSVTEIEGMLGGMGDV